MREVYRKSPPLSIEMVIEELRRTKQLESVGGIPYLLQVSGRMPTTANALAYRDKLHELHVLRQLIQVNTAALEQAFDFSGELSELTNGFRKRIEEIDSRASAQAGVYTVWSLDDFEKYTPPTDAGILFVEPGYPIWSKGVIGLLLGPPGIGKSRLALQLAIDQITGQEWCGIKTLPPARKWLMVGNENSKARWKHDITAMTLRLGKKAKERIKEHLFLQVPDTIHDNILGLDQPAAEARLRATLKTVKPDILVLDPWQSFIIGSDANDNAAAAQTCILISRLMLEAGLVPTVLIVHHAKTGAEAALGAVGYDAASYAKGAKSIYGIARSVINVAPGDQEDGGKLVIACGKANDAKRFETRGVSLDQETYTYAIDSGFDMKEWQDDVQGKRTGSSVTIADCVEAVKDGHHTAGEITDHLHETTGAAPRLITRRVSESVKKGYLQRVPPRGNYTLGNVSLPCDAPAPLPDYDHEQSEP
jgi:hypothetical protein